MKKDCGKGNHKFVRTDSTPGHGYNKRLRQVKCSKCGRKEYIVLTERQIEKEQEEGC